jgi:hypothetical protein
MALIALEFPGFPFHNPFHDRCACLAGQLSSKKSSSTRLITYVCWSCTPML